MPDSENGMSKKDGEAALHSIHVAEESARRKATEPLWFIAVTAITILIVFVGIQPEGPNGLMPLILLSLIRLWMVRKQGLVPLSTGRGARRWARGVGALGLFYLAVVYLFRIQELSMAPLIGGTIGAVLYTVIAESERRRAMGTTSRSGAS